MMALSLQCEMKIAPSTHKIIENEQDKDQNN